MSESNREFWGVELESRNPAIEKMEFPTDIAALDFVAQLRSLGDPAFTPSALIQTKQVVATEVIRTPLGGTATKQSVVDAIKRSMVANGGTADGRDPVEWMVDQVFKELEL